MNNGASAINSHARTNYLIYGCNIVSNNYRELDYNAIGAAMKFIPDSSGTIEYCNIGHNKGSGIWYDECNSDQHTIIRNNIIHHNTFKGIYIEVSSNVQAYNNLLLNNGSGICVADSYNTKVFNNTIMGSYDYAALRARGGYRVEDGFSLRGTRFYNNLICNNSSVFDLVMPLPGEHISDNISDNNCIYRSIGEASYATDWNNRVPSLQEWQTLSGGDLNSTQANPQLLQSDWGLCRLSSASPIINFGTNLQWLSECTGDFFGNPRIMDGNVDIGCYEFGID